MEGWIDRCKIKYSTNDTSYFIVVIVMTWAFLVPFLFSAHKLYLLILIKVMLLHILINSDLSQEHECNCVFMVN